MMKPMKQFKKPKLNNSKPKVVMEFNMNNKSKSKYKYGISESEVKKDKSLPYVMSFTDIKTPTTVEEFRENLLKYYVSYGRDVMVGHNDKNMGDFCVDDIESMSDLGFWDDFSWNGSDSDSPTLMMTPTVVQIRDFDDYMEENFMFHSGSMDLEEVCVSWWLNPQNNLIIDNIEMRRLKPIGENDYMKLCDKYQKNVYWKNFYKEGNSLFRDFYQKTLGEFGGRGEWSYDDEGNRLEVKEVV